MNTSNIRKYEYEYSSYKTFEIRIHSVSIIHIYEYYSVLHSTSSAIIQALQKAIEELSKYGSRARTCDLVIFRLMRCQFGHWLQILILTVTVLQPDYDHCR